VQGGTDERPQDIIARGLDRRRTESPGTASALHDDLAWLGLAWRYRAILEVANGLSLVAVARSVDLTEKHVRKWVQRFLKDRLEGLRDRPGRGRKPLFSPRVGDVCSENRLRTAG
jgi:hypothetical protein